MAEISYNEFVTWHESERLKAEWARLVVELEVAQENKASLDTINRLTAQIENAANEVGIAHNVEVLKNQNLSPSRLLEARARHKLTLATDALADAEANSASTDHILRLRHQKSEKWNNFLCVCCNLY
jgi:hypothetical protein